MKSAGFFTLSATGAKWPADGFCSVYDDEPVQQQRGSYKVSADLYNVNTKVGHPGVMYNAKDNNNYDFVYFR